MASDIMYDYGYTPEDLTPEAKADAERKVRHYTDRIEMFYRNAKPGSIVITIGVQRCRERLAQAEYFLSLYDIQERSDLR